MCKLQTPGIIDMSQRGVLIGMSRFSSPETKDWARGTWIAIDRERVCYERERHSQQLGGHWAEGLASSGLEDLGAQESRSPVKLLHSTSLPGIWGPHGLRCVGSVLLGIVHVGRRFQCFSLTSFFRDASGASLFCGFSCLIRLQRKRALHKVCF